MTTPPPPPAGLYPVLTRVPFSDKLLASPGEYDAAPNYLRAAFQDRGDEVRVEIARSTAAAVADRAVGDTLGRQLMIAVELTAPIGMGVVRSAAIAKSLAALVVHFNPVTAVLAVPALFFAARRTLTDMRRALVTDPKVRGLIERAQASSKAGDTHRAESLLAEALDQDVDPTYRRNGDLYLQLGMVQMQGGRPRKAMVSLAKASVLFSEKDVLAMPRSDGTVVKLSKRGWTEMLACAAIDSFAKDESGIDEWAELIGDFAASSEKRFESIAEAKDSGRLFGLFGVDKESASVGRELAAKVRFLAAKAKLWKVATADDPMVADRLLDEAVRDLLAAEGLDPAERFLALMEQAQFYTSIAHSDSDRAVEHGARAMMLMEAAAGQLDASDPARAAQTRAEAVAFALELMPNLVARGRDVAALRESTRCAVELVGDGLESAASHTSLATVGRAWAHDVRYQLAEDEDGRRAAIEASYDAYIEAGEPVAAMYAALRSAYLAESKESTAGALERLVHAARQVLNGDDSLSSAFATKYLLAASEVTGSTVGPERFAEAAGAFLAAAEEVVSKGEPVPFTLHGKRVLHSASAADAILRQHAASLYARAGEGAQSIALFERVRAELAHMAPADVQRRYELEFAEVLRHLGYRDRAQMLAEKAERDARGLGDPHLQRRALEILHAIGKEPLEASEPDLAALEPGAASWLSDYLRQRDRLVLAGRELLSVLSSEKIRARLERSSDISAALVRLEAEIRRIAEDRFEIGVVGEFSAGKSTFINALLGERVLPSSVRPTTSAPNRLRHGHQPGLRVFFQDGRTEHGDLASLKKLITERGNPANEKGVSHVEIAYPSPLLQSGLQILDTPGLSSLVAAHEEVTRRAIPDCDAILVVAAARQPFTASLDSFLDGVGRLVESRMFYVLNKIDQIEPERRAEVVKFVTDQMHKRGVEARVLAVSSYRALASRRLTAGTLDLGDVEDDPRLGDERDPQRLLDESQFEELEGALGQFLSAHRGMPRLRETAHNLHELLYQIELALTTEQCAARLQTHERLTAYQRLAAEVEAARADTHAALSKLDESLNSAVKDARARARAELVARVDDVLEAVGPSVSDLQDDRTREALRQRIRAAIEAAGRDWVATAARRLSADVQESIAIAQAILSRHKRGLRLEFGKAVGFDAVAARVDLGAAEIDFDVSANREARLAVEVTFGFVGVILLGTLGVLLGGALGKVVSALLFDGDEALAEKLRDTLRPTIARTLASLGESLGESIEAAGERQVGAARARLEEQRREMLAEFHNRLASLVTERRADEAEERELTKLLADVQGRAADARGVVVGLLEGAS